MELEIIGIGCRFPGRVVDVRSYWNLLCGSESAVGPMPADRFNPDPFLGRPGEPGKAVTFRGGWLEHIDRFDHSYFHLSRRGLGAESLCAGVAPMVRKNAARSEE